ncbi:ArsR/SmtB family transcription factor [Angustibacter sp. McL0619]|uniref:ArsR/SmtB family transcription factor n=1 Tax=Angustibacter sp. McL0619 TaxID=3415676 RepID=UPI003CE76F0E
MSDAEIPLRAFAHPLRLQILSLLTGTAMSAAEVAREIGGTQANASYHLRQLLDAGLLDVAEAVSVRGGMAKRYRHDPQVGNRLTPAGTNDRLTLAAALGEELRRRTLRRREGVPGPLTDAELWVDPQVWEDVCNRVVQAMTDLHDAAQAPRAPGTIRTSTTMSMFVMHPEPEPR